MTTDATPTLESLTTAFNAAEKAFTDLQATNAPLIDAAMKAADFATVVSLGSAVTKAQKAFEEAKSSLSDFSRFSKWGALDPIRKDYRDGLRALFVKAPPVTRLESISGTITLEAAEGETTAQAIVSLTPVWRKADIAPLEASIAGLVNAQALLDQGVTSIDVSISGLMGESPVISENPTPSNAKPAKGASSTDGGPRSGAKVYIHNGKSYGAKAYLEAVKDVNTSAATWLEGCAGGKNPRGADKSGNDNGASNYALNVAKSLGDKVETKAS